MLWVAPAADHGFGRGASGAACRPDLGPVERHVLTFSAMPFAQGDPEASSPGWTEARRLGAEVDDRVGRADGAAGEGLIALATANAEGAS